MLLGGCHCGDIRYEAAGAPFHAVICHCSICRRMSGAPMVAWFSVLPQDFRWVRGVPAQFRSTPQVARSFCPRCGTQLTFVHEALADEIAITTASLDEPNAVPPGAHIHVATRLRWLQLDDGLPEHAEDRKG